MLRLALALLALLGLTACGVDTTFAPQAQVDAARYVEGPPNYIILYTGVNGRTKSGAHSALVINASQRVIFDPAGTFEHPLVPIQNDVHYGITDQVLASFLDYHTRDSASEKYSVIERKLYVSPQIAEMILQRVQAHGAVPKMQCAQSISAILRQIPGFESLPSTWYPVTLGEAFGTLPGVQTRLVDEAASPKDQHNVVFVDKRGNPVSPAPPVN